MHRLFFSSRVWLGEGTITFSSSPEQVRFSTKWSPLTQEEGIWKCQQLVEMHGHEERQANTYTFTLQPEQKFHVRLENEMMGAIEGQGVLSDQAIGWELKGMEGFEGLEIYEEQTDGSYHFRAEFSSGDTFRTLIEGQVWCAD